MRLVARKDIPKESIVMQTMRHSERKKTELFVWPFSIMRNMVVTPILERSKVSGLKTSEIYKSSE